MKNKIGKLQSHTSSNMAYCKIPHKKWQTNCTIRSSWSLRPHILPIIKANIIAACLENQFRVHDLCDCGHGQHVKAQVEALPAIVDEDIPVNF
jgi:hypothetical protein